MRRLAPLLICLFTLPFLRGADGGPVAGAPVELAVADRVHAGIHRRFAPAVVGLSCQGTFNGRPSGFYGTGAVITPEGLILTNITVVPKDGHDIKVYFTDGHVRPAEVVAIRAGCEAVLLKLSEPQQDLPHMPLARSADVKVGDPVYSWGNPHLTIQRDGMVSLSVGAVSGKYEMASVDDQSRYVGPVIEVDAAVNPGSDGGPITDRRGNLIGIMSLAFSPTRWLGVAIPTDEIRAAMDELQQIRPAPRVAPLPSEKKTWSTRLALQAAARQVEDAVVTVYVVRKGDKEQPPENRQGQTLAARAVYPRNQRAALERIQGPVGAATGFIVDPAGIVVTTAFNVGDAVYPRTVRDKKGRIRRKNVKRKVEAIYVYLGDQRYDAKVLGTSTGYDLAVLEIQNAAGTKLPFIDMTAGAPLKTGTAVAVLGRSEPPGTLQLNGGSVSAVDRVKGLAVQVSALCNYGNQGGPVIDREGRLVGMASHLRINSTWRQNCGVGFVLRAAHLADAVPLLREGKEPPKVKRPGIAARISVNADVAGAQVTEVEEGGAADQAGLQAGDVIVALGGETVTDFITYNTLLMQTEVGDEVAVTVNRGGQVMELKLTIAAEED